MSKYVTTRVITKTECPWLKDDIQQGTEVYKCTRATYGCISPRGKAMTFDSQGGYPFFELPNDALLSVDIR